MSRIIIRKLDHPIAELIRIARTAHAQARLQVAAFGPVNRHDSTADLLRRSQAEVWVETWERTIAAAEQFMLLAPSTDEACTCEPDGPDAGCPLHGLFAQRDARMRAEFALLHALSLIIEIKTHAEDYGGVPLSASRLWDRAQKVIEGPDRWPEPLTEHECIAAEETLLAGREEDESE